MVPLTAEKKTVLQFSPRSTHSKDQLHTPIALLLWAVTTSPPSSLFHAFSSPHLSHPPQFKQKKTLEGVAPNYGSGLDFLSLSSLWSTSFLVIIIILTTLSHLRWGLTNSFMYKGRKERNFLTGESKPSHAFMPSFSVCPHLAAGPSLSFHYLVCLLHIARKPFAPATARKN